ncbi:MAG TPA: hypothetical protein VI759_00575 [Dehalococcoidia bacterium]|nr:hypothetical protein [Dehalococcoidia bacterium]
MRPSDAGRPAAEPRPLGHVVPCPSCGASIDSMGRWSLVCHECGHAWEDRSARSAIDEIRDAGDDIGTWAMRGFVLFAAGFFAWAVIGKLFRISDQIGAWDAWWFVAALIITSLSIVAIGWRRLR